MRAPDGPPPGGAGDRAGLDRQALEGGYRTQNPTHKPDLILLAELWERTGSRGTRYISGYLGRAKLVAFVAKDQPREGVIVWKLFAAPNERDDGR